MHKTTYRSLLMCGTALLGLSLWMNNANADTTPATTNATPTTTTVATAQSTTQDLPVVTNQDNAAKPSETTDWKNPADYAGKVPVQILGINDLHGGLELGGKAGIDGHNYADTGTVARLASYLNEAEKTFKQTNPNGTTIRVEAGDMVGASPANSALLQDEPTMQALKEMGVTIGTLGNHEFDEGLPEFLRIVNGQAPTKHYNEAMDKYTHVPSGINIITANVVNKADGPSGKKGEVPYGLQPYFINEIHTADDKVVKVGFIGIETTSLPILTLYDNYKDFDVLDEAETIAKYAKVLRSQGVNAIVVLAHTAVASTNGETKGDAVDILQKLNRIDPNNSVDIYVAAHSHQYANAKVGQTTLVQAIYTGKAYDDIVGYLDPTTNDFVPDSIVSHVYPVLSEKDDPATKADPKVAKIVQVADELVNPVINKPIGKAATPETITGRLNNSKTMENGAGEVVVDGQLYEAKKVGLPADFAMTNTGGVRADIVVDPKTSEITWGSAQAVQPFGNILRVVEMTGAQIEKALNQQYDEGQKYYLQIAGLKYIYTDQNDPDQPFKVVKMYKADGTPIKADETYNVVINDFLAGGGDGFSAFKDQKLVGIVGQDTESFINYITDMTANQTPIKKPALDRKVYMTNAEVAALEAAEAKGQDQPAVTPTTPAPEIKDPSYQPGNDEAKVIVTTTNHQTTTKATLAKTTNAQAKTLPQTGNQTNSFAAFGLLLLSFLGFNIAKKREN